MNCAEAKQLIPLDAGDDLRADERLQLSCHLEACPDCRSDGASMSRAMTALLRLRATDDQTAGREGVVTSVWPRVMQAIAKRHTSPATSRKFNLQVAALSVCSLSLAVVTIVQTLSSMRETSIPSGFLPARNVSQSPMQQSEPLSRLLLPSGFDQNVLKDIASPADGGNRDAQSF